MAMKMRYERMMEMDEEIEEENIVKEQFVISDDVSYDNDDDDDNDNDVDVDDVVVVDVDVDIDDDNVDVDVDSHIM